MIFDTLLLESKADSVDICSHINNKTVQYKYKDSVCVHVYVCVCIQRTVLNGAEQYKGVYVSVCVL